MSSAEGASAVRGERAAARRLLLAWFRTNGPVYPWRERERDPYAVLVSEVMLQQTQASRVIEAFPVFMNRFPDVGSLAEASRGDVLRAWGGLGYPRRAASLHESAAPHRSRSRRLRAVRPLRVARPSRHRSVHGGRGDVDRVSVTPVAAIDTNVRKVMARLELAAEPDEVADTDVVEAASRWLAREAPGDWNQAVMNLGREVCRPTPRCAACPLASVCAFRARGRIGRRSGRRQPAFAGSMRQARGGVLRELRGRERAASIGTIAAALDLPVTRVDLAVDALERDGLVRRTGSGRVGLPR